MMSLYLFLMVCFPYSSPQDAVIVPSVDQFSKSDSTKIERSLLSRIQEFNNAIEAGASHSTAFRRFEGLISNRNEELKLALGTTGNDLDVAQYVSRLGGTASIGIGKQVDCYARPEIIRKIAQCKDVLRIEALSPAIYQR